MKRLSYLVLAILITACSSIDCPVNSVVETIYEVYNSNGEKLNLSDTLTVTSVRSDGTDTLLLNKLIGSSTINLPISYSHPEDILVFHFDNANNDSLHVADTVWIKKEDIPHFESVDCNSTFFHVLTDVRYTQNYIDSIVIKNPLVTYDYQTVHFFLYPKVSH